MLTGRSIEAVAVELNRQLSTKKDTIAPASAMEFVGGKLRRKDSGKTPLVLTDYAHHQLANYLKVPGEYYDRMRAQTPDLLDNTVNTWLTKQERGSKRLIRMLDGRVRSILSDRFLAIDNYDVLSILLPSIQEAGCTVVSAELTERKMYIKALAPRITGEIRKGDIVQAGLVLSNSEIGAGSVQVSPLMYRLACLNGLIVEDMNLRRNHVGRRIRDEELDSNQYLSREAVAADIRAFLLKARDTVKAVLDQSVFGKIVDKAKYAAGIPIDNAEEAVEDVTGRFQLSDPERNSVMDNLIKGGDLSRWGLVNAITATAHNDTIVDFDRSVELERAGGELLYSASRN